jgi:tRNA pseudouridine38-40 synthase
MRLALGVSYLGTPYEGWQSQPSRRTVQDKLEEALGQFTQQTVSTVCAGRTDAGVHALMQVVHFDTALDREDFSWIRGTNRFLPGDIAVQWARRVPDAFHSRASATARRYTYVLLESIVRPSLDAGRVGWSFRPLDGTAMHAAAAYLHGTHDFTSFRASECQARSPVKTLQRVGLTRRGAYWRFDFEADAFLHHMIRNIMGCLVTVGQGLREPSWIRDVIDARDRDAAAPTFSPDGLYFLGPVYGPEWELPSQTPAYDWLPPAP